MAEDHESGLMCNNFDTFLDKNQYFLRFAAIRKKMLFVSIGYSTELKHGILIIHCLFPGLATPLNRPIRNKLNKIAPIVRPLPRNSILKYLILCF